MLDTGSRNLQFMFPFPTDFVKVLEEKMLPHVGRRRPTHSKRLGYRLQHMLNCKICGIMASFILLLRFIVLAIPTILKPPLNNLVFKKNSEYDIAFLCRYLSLH